MSTLTTSTEVENLDEGEDLHHLTLSFEDRSFDKKEENIPVYEGDDLLKDIVLRRFNRSHTRAALYYFSSMYAGSCVVVALSEESALNWLADLGVLDGMKVPEDEVKEKFQEHGHVPDSVPLGNASEYFQLENYRLEEVSLSNVEHFNSRIIFNQDGFMHIWKDNSYNDDPPIHDYIVQLKNLMNWEEEFGVDNYWVPNSSRSPSEEFIKKRVRRDVWNLIKENR